MKLRSRHSTAASSPSRSCGDRFGDAGYLSLGLRLWLVPLLIGWGAMASARPAAAQRPDAAPDMIVVVGAGGEPEFGEAFTGWADSWEEAARRSGAGFTRIGDEKSVAGDAAAGLTDRERLQMALTALDPDRSEPVWLILLGHGTFGQNIAKFNLRGPDVSGDDLAGWVRDIRRPLVVIAAFSASGPFINALSGENRVIVTATQSGIEQNYARFGEYVSAAILDPHSDLDHDGEVSVLEAFLAGAAGVRRFYQTSGRLLTENALLDDNADGLGTPATAFRGTRAVAKTGDPTRSLDGGLAAKITLAPDSERIPFTPEEVVQRNELEAELERLHDRRADLGEADYEAAVLPTLVRLAKLYRAAQTRLTEPGTDPATKEPAATERLGTPQPGTLEAERGDPAGSGAGRLPGMAAGSEDAGSGS
ncbi:MAG: hypothetical protein EA381_10280 [Planctomycetaceae bacterium]|nr:MAG: hypothetical protein EA381_10280 [Planctomycetaceae bacterium]